MDKRLLIEFQEQAIAMVEEAIRLIKASGLQNEQSSLDFADRLNKLSIEL